ncbi:MAG: lipoyl synthase [Acidimicrobiaceae bacterium]|nr:lipoyl synthase [Ilumatobacter sp.]MCB0982985.1 lipoyl synthase [Ilumatobacter sp.]MCB9379582.1 lipoyl synthase [Acidimicrobiaceae bacterium]
MAGPLRVRWLGRVPYREALALQQALFTHGAGDHLLLLEHPHVFTHGPRADLATNLRVEPASVGAELVGVKRGGDVTYHGPGQLVGYPIVGVPNSLGAGDHVCAIQRLVVGVLQDLGVADVGCLDDYPGVWVGVSGPNPRKICAIGVRLAHGRTMHGFALNVQTDLRYMREYIVPCGIGDKPVTSLAEEGVDVPMEYVVDLVATRAAATWGDGSVDRQDVAWKQRPEDLAPFSRGEGPGAVVRSAGDHGVPTLQRAATRLAQAGVSEGLAIATRKPDWLRPKVVHDRDVLALKQTVRGHGLVTVCEEAGCPNLSECWKDRTATFMVLGERCTRACGFCLVDTRRPAPPAADEPARVAAAAVEMGLRHAVLTMVARDDLPDGGMGHVAACVTAIRDALPGTTVETLISDAHGDADALGVLFDVRPDVLNHNMETVARLQRAVRPSAGYARSLGVLAAAKAAGLTVKSGFMVGLGETPAEVEGLLADLAAVGADIVTVGQYLRPTSHHLPVARWVEPAEFAAWAATGEALGIGHVEASPLTRSSYHAREAAASVMPVAVR